MGVHEEEFRRRGRWLLLLRMLLGGVIITVLTGGAVATAGLMELNGITHDLQATPAAKLRPDTVTEAQSGKPQTILLVGSDHRYGAAGNDARSDTLMLVRLDPKQRATTVLSIPRDLAVNIPGRGLAKINEAYSAGGLDLTARTIKTLLSTPDSPFRINHTVATTFSGFTEAVDHIGCVYVDVDRRYYHSNAGLPVSEHWSEIDVRPGYQKLCGTQALAYVRFRHLDNDIVRAARQQGFLRAAVDQVRRKGIIGQLRPLVRIFAKATETDADLHRSRGLLRLAKLAAASSGKPVQEIHFPATFVAHTAPQAGTTFGAQGQPLGATAALGDYVTTTPVQLRKVAREFMHPSAPPKVVKTQTKRHAKAKSGLVASLSDGKSLALASHSRKATRMRIYVPAWLTPRGSYPASTMLSPNPRRYVVTDYKGDKHAAYRFVIQENASQGQYYGVQGTTWTNPPILDAKHQTRRIGGRTFSLYGDGGHLRLVAWSTPNAVYWVSNTLSLDLTNREMLGIAGSLTRVTRR
jgi:polyisoprenyl-teichoic acid--peptidoglycan teichoic acid transferase